MSKLHLRRSLSGFVPSDAESEELCKRFKPGEIYRATISVPRNYRAHCLFMSLLTLCFNAQEKYDNPRMFRRAVAYEAGHVRQTITLHGEIVLSPLSYSYDELPDEHEFTIEFGKAMAVCQKMMHDIGELELRDEVNKYANAHFGVTL